MFKIIISFILLQALSAYVDSSCLNSPNNGYTPETPFWLWDHTTKPLPQEEIQWFFILIAVVIVLFLSGMVTLIMLRSLHKNIARYNQNEVVNGGNLKPPRNGMLLSVFLVVISMVTLAFACFAFLVRESPGALIICSVGLFVCLLTPAGFVLAGVNKSFGVQEWKSKVILASIVCPGIIFLLFFLINDMLLADSATLPISILIALLALWLGVCVPWTFVGAYFVICRRTLEHPVSTNIIPRKHDIIHDQTTVIPRQQIPDPAIVIPCQQIPDPTIVIPRQQISDQTIVIPRQQIPEQTMDTQPAMLPVGNVLYPKIDELW